MSLPDLSQVNFEYLHRLREEDDAAEAAAEKAATGAAALLLRRLRDRRAEVDLGGFRVEVRVPSPAMRRRIAAMRSRASAADPAELERVSVEIAHVLEKLCVDPSLNAEYWLRGEGFDVEVPARILAVALGLDDAAQEAAGSFRPESKG